MTNTRYALIKDIDGKFAIRLTPTEAIENGIVEDDAFKGSWSHEGLFIFLNDNGILDWGYFEYYAIQGYYEYL